MCVCILLAGTDVVAGVCMSEPREGHDPCQGYVDVLYDIAFPPPPPPPPPPSLPTAEMYNNPIGHGQLDFFEINLSDWDHVDLINDGGIMEVYDGSIMEGTMRWGHYAPPPPLPPPPPPPPPPSLPTAEMYNKPIGHYMMIESPAKLRAARVAMGGSSALVIACGILWIRQRSRLPPML